MSIKPIIHFNHSPLIHSETLSFTTDITKPQPLVVSYPLREEVRNITYLDLVYYFAEDKADPSSRAFSMQPELENGRHVIRTLYTNLNIPISSGSPVTFKSDTVNLDIYNYITNVIARDNLRSIAMNICVFQGLTK